MMSERTRINELMPERRQDRTSQPSIREYFIEYGNEIRNKGFVDKIKMTENMRILSLNIKGCRLNNNQRIREIREAMEKKQIDVALLCEANTKWNTRNIDKIENEMKELGRGTTCITADSNQWKMTTKDYLPGGLMNVIMQRFATLICEEKVIKGRLGNWISIPMICNGKRIEIISIYRIPITSESEGVFSSLAQYHMKDAKIKKAKDYRREIFDEIKRHIQGNESINDIIIAGDYNQNINDREVKKFHEDIGVREVHAEINNIRMDLFDKTYKNGSKPIDSIAASCGIMDFIEGCELLNYNEFIDTDHRAYVIDVNIDEYFNEEFNEWDKINKVLLNPARRTHRERFVEAVEDQLQLYSLEEDLNEMSYETTRNKIEVVDEIISRVLETARKKVEGMKRNIPFSREKMRIRAKMLYARMQLRKLKGGRVDVEIMRKRQEEGELEGIEYETIDAAKEALVDAKQHWEMLKQKGIEIREAELMDYHHKQLNENDENYKMKKKKILRGIRKTMQRNHEFRYLTRYAGKGKKDCVKRIYESDENNIITKAYIDRQSIEDRIIEYNTQHFEQAKQSIAFRDKIYKELKKDSMRNKILDGTINENECDDERIYQFLKLLKRQQREEWNINENEITKEKWIKVVKQSKKRSASSIFSRRTYSVYKCALGSEKMTRILVMFYNIVIKNRYYLKRWENIVDVILDKGKGMIIGKLRTITLIEADLQYVMRIYLNDEQEERIEFDNRISTSNYGSRKNYSIETAILEKRLIMDNSLMTCQPTIYHLTDLKSCYDRQLINIGGLLEESLGRDRNVMKMLTNLIPRWKHYVSTAHGISKRYYGGSENELAGTGQGNKFSGDLCRDTSCMIIKVLEKNEMGVKYVSKLSRDEIIISAIAFVDDTDLVIDGDDLQERMQRMLQQYNDLYTATGGLIEQNKSMFFAWQWKWTQGNKRILDKKVTITINNEQVKERPCEESEKTLGVYISPSMKWVKQFQSMMEKMREAVFKLSNIEIVPATAHIFYNAYLTKKVYFGSGIFTISEQQEDALKRVYEPILLKKMRLSEKFPRSVLYSRKTAMGIGLLAPRTIVDILALKLYVGHQRMNSKVAKIIQINEDNARLSYGYSRSVLETKRSHKPKQVIWSDEIQAKLDRRRLKIENRLNERTWISKNLTIMDYAIKYVDSQRLKEEILAPINQIRIHKRMLLPCELVGFNGESKTKEMREKELKSCVEWKFKYDEVPKPSAKSYEIWERFMEWIGTQQIETIVDFEPWVTTKFQMSSDGEYIKEKSKNGFNYYGKGETRYGQQTYVKLDLEITSEWKKVIAELKPNGGFEVYGVFYTHHEQSEPQYYPFDEETTESIQSCEAVAATDASVKDGMMGGRWIMSNTQRTFELSGELFHKEWNENTAGVAEVITLLELITVLERRGRHINEGCIEIGFDNKKQYHRLMSKMSKSNMWAQEAGAEVAMIKEHLKQIKFEVRIKLIKGHEKQIGRYDQNPTKHLLKECDREARRTRETIKMKNSLTNIKFNGSYCIKQDGKIQSRAIQEMIRIIDAKEKEDEYAQKKYQHKYDFIDMDARNAFKAGEVSTSILKFTHGYNHYGVRNAMVNSNMIEETCPRCEEPETWDHVIKCSSTIYMRRKFIRELVVELVQKKPDEVHVEEIMSFVEDILRYLENAEDEEFEMNQQYVGMKELFRGYVVIDWEGTNLRTKKYKELNKIIVKRCVQYYDECWKHRNEEYHNEEKQRKRIITWYERVRKKAENSNDNQIRMYVNKKVLDVERSKTDTIKRWIYNLKEFEKRMEKTKKSDIRRYFEV